MPAIPVYISMAVLSLFITGSTTNAKVVVLFSIPHTANVRTHTNVGRALTEMGHEAYVCIPHFMMREKVINVQGVKVIEYGKDLGDTESKLFSNLGKKVFEKRGQSPFDMLNLVLTVKKLVIDILRDEDLVSKIKKVKPDLLLLFYNGPFKASVILPYMLNVPFAYMSPFVDLHVSRVPFSPSSTACPLTHGFKPVDASFLDRLKQFVCHSIMIAFDFVGTYNSLVAEFAPNRPQVSINEISRMMEVYIAESDHILDHARPTIPNMKFVGGTAPTPARPLKEPFKSFVEKASNGVAVVTFGSGVVDLPESIAHMMIKAFEQVSLQIVWRVNVTSPNPSKIMTSRWVPQNDVLAHKNTKLFVSHCGANGQYESLYHGVPILCLPLFGDQFYNSHRSTSKGFGLSANLFDITDTELTELMKEIIENPKYRNNIQKASILFRKLYKNPVKEAAFWIDHVMEYGGGYMRSSGQEMTWYQFLVLDIVTFILVIIIVFIVLAYGLCLCCCRMCKKSSYREGTKKRDKNE